ncbi:MAG: hypothetical protein Q9170_004459 [Blastenia crenularia]
MATRTEEEGCARHMRLMQQPPKDSGNAIDPSELTPLASIPRTSKSIVNTKMRTQPSATEFPQLSFHQASTSRFDDPIYNTFYNNSTAPRINTDTVLVSALRKDYPKLHLTVTPIYSANLLAFAAAGHATATPSATAEQGPLHESASSDPLPSELKWRRYIPPAQRVSESHGALVDRYKFGRFVYNWSNHTYIMYNIIGSQNNYDQELTYLLGESAEANDELLLAACYYWTELHDEVLVYDGGYWQKSHKLWESVQNSTWDDVILAPEMKKDIIGEMSRFFGSQERYRKLKVPWKRGLIYYGPPGNGKTISLKAMMHTLYHLPSPIPTLYVRSLSTYGGPEYAISSIFNQARKQAPCLLVFEDLDSIVTDRVRSYFLNEVDGLENNDGILMIGSTNHLERLDKGIKNRPSRFDRKYLFPVPGMEERVAYCEFWRKKLGNREQGKEEVEVEVEVEFPEVLCQAIAGITGGFSFAYIQEAFVASLLAIAASEEGEEDVETVEPMSEWDVRWKEAYAEGVGILLRDGDQDLDRYELWRQMKKQVKNLKDELDAGKGEEE